MGFQGSDISSNPDWKSNWPRLHYAAKGPVRATVLLLSSGRVRDMSSDSPDAVLLRALAEGLAMSGVASINPRLPLREDGLTDSDAALIALRADLASDALPKDSTHPLAVLAISLGTQTALALAAAHETARHIDALFLLSGIIENPVAPRGRIRSVDLIYGGRDHVGYLHDSEDKVRDIEGPRDYGPRSCKHLVTGPGMRSAVHILPDAGHALEVTANNSFNHHAVRALLVPLVLDRLGLTAAPAPDTTLT